MLSYRTLFLVTIVFASISGCSQSNKKYECADPENLNEDEFGAASASAIAITAAGHVPDFAFSCIQFERQGNIIKTVFIPYGATRSENNTGFIIATKYDIVRGVVFEYNLNYSMHINTQDSVDDNNWQRATPLSQGLRRP